LFDQQRKAKASQSSPEGDKPVREGEKRADVGSTTSCEAQEFMESARSASILTRFSTVEKEDLPVKKKTVSRVTGNSHAGMREKEPERHWREGTDPEGLALQIYIPSSPYATSIGVTGEDSVQWGGEHSGGDEDKSTCLWRVFVDD